ncbi:hypothetical protein H7F51_16405 [Novosphingobium flavum]|uniref:Uncharacterized protein n=1 Tax=Novosphingobium flavum TaxID=1778672 RepID=A0A7X1FVF2_9SPHN|nr:hypothetical protein [Novosphingobium flavum]MBC2667102.1 hypothetical protein [Novosphingobium flavum]
MARFRKARETAVKAEESLPASPSPNPMTNLVLADIALRGGGRLLRHAIERGLLGRAYSPKKAESLIKGRTMGQTLIGTALARIATRSLPGALLVGGGMLAKTLYERRHARAQAASGGKAVDRQAVRGKRAGGGGD